MDVFVFGRVVHTLILLMTASARPLLLASGVLGLTGVALGAFGAHTLKPVLTANDTVATWQTAAHYQLIHAVALLALAGSAERWPLARWIGRSWLAGVVLFSGSLYGLSVGGPKFLGPVTPLGGGLLLVGWALVIVGGWRRAATQP